VKIKTNGHFQQYISYIVAVSFIGGENRSTWRKSLTTLSHTVVSSKPRMSEVQTHNISDHSHRLHR